MARLKRATARVALLALAVGSAVGAGALVASAASGTVTLTLAGDHTYVAGEQVELGIAYSDTSFSGVAELQRWDEGNAAWDSILEYDMVDGVVADFLYIRDGLGEPEQVRAVVDGTPSDAITVTREAFESSVTGDMDLLPGDESFLGITTNADYMDGPANVYTWDEATDTWLIYDEVTMGGGVGAFQPDPWRARSYMVGFYEETGEFENFFSDRFDVEVWFENPYVEWDPEFYYGESVYADLHWGGFGTSDVVTLQYYVEPVGSTAGYWTNSALGSVVSVDGYTHVEWQAAGTTQYRFRVSHLDGPEVDLDPFTMVLIPSDVVAVPDAASIPANTPAGATVTVEPAPATGTARIQYLNGDVWTTFGPVITLTDGTGHVAWNPGTSEFTYRFVYWTSYSDPFEVGIVFPTVTGTPDAASIPPMTPAGATVTVDPAPASGTARIQYLNRGIWTTFGPEIALTDGTGHVTWNPGTSEFTYRFVYGNYISDTFTVGILAPTVTGVPDAASIPPGSPAGATVTVDPAPTTGTARIQYLNGSTWTTFGP
ncbi:MAG: hypothetical protein JW722_04795, partial [Demequinaceae bacterium]|nr:hypothetical protein [Demequinaceae bacterium]